MTAKSQRIRDTNRNRYRIRQHSKNCTPSKQRKIEFNNLGYKVKHRKLEREKSTIKSFIRTSLRRVITEPIAIYAEDLSQPIRGKKQSKQINRKLNQWMKGELQDSLSTVAKETGSVLKVVNAAYTSQVDSHTRTLLGSRCGDRFICYSGDVVQADFNASRVILDRGVDPEITRWMKKEQVRSILLLRTVRYLHSIKKSVVEALNLGWLHSKFKAEALRLEASIT